MKTKHILTRLSALIVVTGSLFLYSCEPRLCAWCYERGTLHVDRDIEICADNEDELWELVDHAEAMGYECELKGED